MTNKNKQKIPATSIIKYAVGYLALCFALFAFAAIASYSATLNATTPQGDLPDVGDASAIGALAEETEEVKEIVDIRTVRSLPSTNGDASGADEKTPTYLEITYADGTVETVPTGEVA